MPRQSALRIFDADLKIIGYMLPEVCGFRVPANVKPGQEWEVFLYPRNERAHVAPDFDPEETTVTVERAKFKFDHVVFYGPGKYAGSPPDATLFNLLLLEAPDDIWDTPGWIKREHLDPCNPVIH